MYQRYLKVKGACFLVHPRGSKSIYVGKLSKTSACESG